MNISMQIRGDDVQTLRAQFDKTFRVSIREVNGNTSAFNRDVDLTVRSIFTAPDGSSVVCELSPCELSRLNYDNAARDAKETPPTRTGELFNIEVSKSKRAPSGDRVKAHDDVVHFCKRLCVPLERDKNRLPLERFALRARVGVNTIMRVAYTLRGPIMIGRYTQQRIALHMNEFKI